MTLTKEQLIELVGTIIDGKVKELGLTAVDRRHVPVPQLDVLMGRAPMNAEQAHAVDMFFRGIMIPEAQFNEMRAPDGSNFGAFWKDLNVAAPTEGGYLVPTEFRAQVVMAMENIMSFRTLATVFPISAKDEIPTVTQKPSMTWGAENENFETGSFAVGQMLLTAQLGRVFIPMSRRLAANARVDIVALLTKLFAEAFSLGEQEVFTNGNGSSKPTGFRKTGVTDGLVTAVSMGAAALTGDDLINLYHAVPQQYRRSSTWQMPDTVIAKIRKLKEAVTGQYLWTPGLAGAPATILGRPVVENPSIPTNLGSASPAVESEIWFGDFSYYYIGDNETMGVEATTTGGEAFRKHQLHLKAWEELDGKMSLPAAFRYLTGVK
jgi:HK97 family phage major capsid protein